MNLLDRLSEFQLKILEVINENPFEWVTASTIADKITPKRHEKVIIWVETALEELIEKRLVVKQNIILPEEQSNTLFEYSLTDFAFQLVNFGGVVSRIKVDSSVSDRTPDIYGE